MVIDSVSDEASLLLPLLENQYDDIVSSQFVLKFMWIPQLNALTCLTLEGDNGNLSVRNVDA